MSFEIEIDYRFDRGGFFDDPAARAAMEAAAQVWEALILDEFADVPAGPAFSMADPSDPFSVVEVTIDTVIDDLRIFVGATETEGRILAFAGPTGIGIGGDVFSARVSGNYRDLGPATDYEPYAGKITFGSQVNWNFALDGPVPGKQDFISTAVHEIGHVLGIGTAAIYNIQRDGDGFAGPNARAVNDGAPVPLEPDGHVQDGLRGNTVLMDPTNRQGQRKTPTEIDLAMLADIGYEIAGFEAQGAALPLATEAGETIFGSEIADRLAGLGGADRIIAGRGDDTLSGGAGEDSLFGGDGADSFRLAPGEGLVRVLDFEFGIDRLLLSADLGIEDAAGLLAAAARPFTNVTDIALGRGTTLRVFHEDATQTPLRVSDFAFEAETGITGSAFADTLAGGDGADRISAGAGDDAILASGGADVIEGGSGVDRALYALPRAALAPDLAEDGSVTLAAPGGTDRLSGVERIATLDGVFLYDIAAEPAALAHRLFAAAFDRLPAEAGLRFWTAALASGTPAEAVAAEFAASAEFAALFGAAADDAAYVTALFEMVLERAPAEAGLAHWTAALASGAETRAGLLLEFADSPENIARTAPDLENGVFVSAEADALLL